MFTTDTDSKFNQSQPANRFSENVQVAMGAMPIVDRINGEIVFNTDHGPRVLLRFGRNGWWLTVSRHEKTGGEMDGAALGILNNGSLSTEHVASGYDIDTTGLINNGHQWT